MAQMLPIEQRLKDLHRLNGAGIAGFAVHFFARHVGGDNVDRKAACPAGRLAQNAIQRCNLARQLRWPCFPDADGHEEPDRPGEGRNSPCKHLRVDAKLIARRQQDIVKPALFGAHDDVTAMLPTGGKACIGHAQKFIIIVAKSGKPSDFEWLCHGSFSPRLATRTSYQV
jgi:hypothetical protein